MNYYEHHLGDYAKDAGHLSMVEDGAYRRLLDAYYIREKPLPVDVRECCKLARSTTKQERDAIAYVLREFFELLDDGHHQRRADAEIERYHDKQRKAAASANARWSQSARNANASPDAMRTHSDGNAKQDANGMPHAGARGMHAGTGARPSPGTSHQSPHTEAELPMGAASKSPRATKKCPESFVPSPEMRAAVLADSPGIDIDRETAKFLDHTFATARTDWAATWRNWMRKAAEKLPQHRGGAAAETPWQRSQRERVAEMTGGLVSRKLPATNEPETIDAIPVAARLG